MNLPFKIREREKKALIIGGIIVVLIFIFYFFTWYKNIRASALEYIGTRQITLEKQFKKISDKENIQKKFEAVSTDIKELEKGLLPDNKPPVAAAEIQRDLKNMALSFGIDIKSERTLNPLDYGLYSGIPVEIGFIASTEKLKNMLYQIKTSAVLFTIPEMKIRVVNADNPGDAYVTLVVKGFIKKTPPAGKNKKQEK